MLRLPIKYEDFNGEEAEDICYFNLSKPELIEMEVRYKKGMATFLKQIVEAEDKQELIKQFKEIVLLAYGIKSDDGKRFMKSDQIREEFSQTAAYQALFMNLATNDGDAIKFFEGVIPKDLRGSFAKASVTPIAPTPPSS